MFSRLDTKCLNFEVSLISATQAHSPSVLYYVRDIVILTLSAKCIVLFILRNKKMEISNRILCSRGLRIGKTKAMYRTVRSI